MPDPNELVRVALQQMGEVPPQLVFIDEKWVKMVDEVSLSSGSSQERAIRDSYIDMRKDFLRHLREEGFEITHDHGPLPEDTIYLTDGHIQIGDEINAFQAFDDAVNAKIDIVTGGKLIRPMTMTVDEYFENPFFPAVFKNTFINGGIDKFLIENQEQLDVIKKIRKDLDGRLILTGTSGSTRSEAFRCCVFQELIETPSDSKTYVRILMSGSGEVKGSGLRFSTGSRGAKPRVDGFVGPFENYFGQYFNATNRPKSVFHVLGGGDIISLSQPKYSWEKQQILTAHGIDPDKPEWPPEMLERCREIMKHCGRELGSLVGFDFIIDKRDGIGKFLEFQTSPAIKDWARDKKGIRDVRMDNKSQMMTAMKLLLELRHEVLWDCMEGRTRNVKRIAPSFSDMIL